ncbi:MAG TPA: YajQ family cyclic di-GMP-binding protein [Symbiobacteriaceae bacterium]|nr:YajQ family cyclic di-GMP-binding protein [Symbiobacteriaceae bacterium]
MADFSFDVVSKVNMAEVVNAVNQSTKEMETRFDFRGSKSSITLDEKEGHVTVVGDDDMKLKNVLDILQTKLVKRGIALRALEYGKVEDAAGGTLRQVITLKQGIAQDKAKQITAAIRDSKLKVKAEIRGDEIRVAGAKKDDLQAVISLLRAKDFGIELQFSNYR